MVQQLEEATLEQAQPSLSMKSLLEAGVHFGHQRRRWNPKMRQYIFAHRNGIHIIDLQQTLEYLERAAEFIEQVSAEGQKVVFVGTKKQAHDTVDSEAERCGAFYNQYSLAGRYPHQLQDYSDADRLPGATRDPEGERRV